jgi:uncharacterized protein YceK
MRGCSSIASNTGAAHLQRKTQKAERFWFAPGAAKKAGSGGSGRAAAATMRGCSSIASNTGAAHLQRKTQKAERFWFAPGAAKKAGSGGSGRAAAATMRGCSSIASNTGAAHLQRKTQKADRSWFARGKIKPNPSTILKGYVRSSETRLFCFQNCAILNSRPILGNVPFGMFDRAVMG